jgi:hypothetical protein
MNLASRIQKLEEGAGPSGPDFDSLAAEWRARAVDIVRYLNGIGPRPAFLTSAFESEICAARADKENGPLRVHSKIVSAARPRELGDGLHVAAIIAVNLAILQEVQRAAPRN